MNCPFVSVHLLFLLNCMNASLHRACCLLQVQAHTTALGGAKVTGWSWAMLPSVVAARAGCAVGCFAIRLVTKWSPLSVSSALQNPGLASDVCVTDFICPFVSVIIRKGPEIASHQGAVGTFCFCCSWRSEVLQPLNVVCSSLEQIANSLRDSLRVMRINLILGEETVCVYIQQITAPCCWDCFRHSSMVRGPCWRKNVHFVWGAAVFCQHLLAVMLSLA